MESDGTRRQTLGKIRILGLLLAGLVVLGTMSACAGIGDSSPTAKEQYCTDLSNLQDSVNALVDSGKNRDMSQFKDNWEQVKTDLNTVKTSAQDVSSPNVDAIDASFNALVASVQNALSASSISAAISSIQSAATDFVNTIKTSFSDLNCSS